MRESLKRALLVVAAILVGLMALEIGLRAVSGGWLFVWPNFVLDARTVLARQDSGRYVHDDRVGYVPRAGYSAPGLTIDSDGLRYVPGESEASYVTRITTTLKSTLRDANAKFVSASSSYDYIQSDDTHPTYTGSTVTIGFIGGSGTGSGGPDYTDAQIVGGKNPVWNQFGHERMGWGLSVYNPATP